MPCPVNKIDSNITGLRYAEEECIGELPVTPIWKPLEPNSYKDFGAEYTQVARNPIKTNRQRSKGVLTDLKAMVGYESDFVGEQFTDILSGFFFAAWRNKASEVCSSVDSTDYTVADGSVFASGDLILAENFAIAGNNGFKVLTGVSTNDLAAAGLAAETPPADATVTKVGVRASSGDVTLTVSGSTVTLGSTTLDFTDLGLQPGEWFFVGGDNTANKFATAACNGFYKARTITATAIVCDKWPTGAGTDAGTGKLIDIFIGNLLKNENTSELITRKTFQFERSYGSAGYEYVAGCVPNVLDLNIKTADKITAEIEFLGLSAADETVAKSGTRPALEAGLSAYNSSSDLMKLALYDEDGNNLSSYITDLKLSVNNNAEILKAAGVLGGFDVSVGDFIVNGSLTAYFVNNNAVSAIRENLSVSISFFLGRGSDNSGWYFDVPNITLGDGKKVVEKDKPITLPLSMEASEDSTFNYTMELLNFKYLPELAFS